VSDLPVMLPIMQLAELKGFDVGGATAELWVFKKSSSAERGVVFTGRWIQTTNDLDNALKTAVNSERHRITEIQEYGLLAQPNESSALSIGTLETHAGLIIDQAGGDIPSRKVRKLKEIENTAFYAIKLVSGDRILYGVKKADFSWRTSKGITVLFSDNILDLAKIPSFDISPRVDFFILDNSIIISQKANFESILHYKEAHKDDFMALQTEPAFAAVFSSLDSLSLYVGENKIQLRRASAIRQKAHYKDPSFMQRLQSRYKEFGLNLIFDSNGKIVFSSETCKDIFQALLDHRLGSAFSTNIYDVQDAAKVSI
jgi:hypothetical protein